MVSEGRAECQGPAGVCDCIRRRRTARGFDSSRPLTHSELEAVLALAAQAPSAHNLQPWRFMVIRSEANRRRVRGLCFGQARITEAPVVLLVLAYHHPHLTDLGAVVSSRLELEHPELVAPKALPGLSERTVGRWRTPAEWATRTTMLAVATLLIAAEGLGLASALVEDFQRTELAAEFGVPADHSLCAVVALGHPRAAGGPPDPGRLPLSELVYGEHFGGRWVAEPGA